MKKLLAVFAVLLLLGTFGSAGATVVDFAGGTAYLLGGSSVVTTNTGLWDSEVDYYIEDGIRVDFIGGYGTIGDYYNNSPSGGIGGYGNSVIHAHIFSGIDIVFTKVDGSTFDLNYVDMTSNTDTGGGLSSGDELSYITTNSGHSLMLAPSDWGVNYTYLGDPGDGIVRNWMDTHFDGITSFTISSDNAYCFGMDNFFIDEPPPIVPIPGAVWLLGSGLIGVVGFRKKMKK